MTSTPLPDLQAQAGPGLLRFTRDDFAVEHVLDAGFMTGCWQQQPALLTHAPTAFEALFGWPALNTLLHATYRTLVPPYIGLFREGHGLAFETYSDLIVDRKNSPFRQVSLAKLQAACARGASLVINAIERIAPPLQALAHAFEDRLHGRAQFNLYFSATPVRCFQPHYDTQDVFVFQVEGRKRWEVWQGREPHPLPGAAQGCATAPQGASESFDLQRGQLLYLPRGTWHAAVASQEPSLHLTLGMHRPTRLDFLQWLAHEAAHDPAWRADLATHAPDDSLPALLRQLAEGDLAGWQRRFERQLQAQREARAPVPNLPAL